VKLILTEYKRFVGRLGLLLRPHSIRLLQLVHLAWYGGKHHHSAPHRISSTIPLPSLQTGWPFTERTWVSWFPPCVNCFTGESRDRSITDHLHWPDVILIKSLRQSSKGNSRHLITGTITVWRNTFICHWTVYSPCSDDV